jgi:hypothetical protein
MMMTDTTMPTLPAMAGLGDLRNMRPVIISDTRERCPLVFSRLPSVKGTLTTGDYSGLGVEHLFSIEKKTISELPGIFTGDRERFERECIRLRGYRFKRLLIIGTRRDIEQGTYRSNVSPKAILHSLSAFECRYDLPVVFAPDVESAARQVESWVYWYCRECVETTNMLLRGLTADSTAV